MAKKSSLKVNAILNATKSSLSIIFPLITYPYALRILGPNGIGKVSYGESLISYFSRFAMLGVTIYGVREGAKRKKNREGMDSFVSELYTINIVTTIIAYFALFMLLLRVDKFKPYQHLILIQSLSIFLTVFGLDWVNVVYEDYKIITIRSIIIHIISMLLLFLFVKRKDDYIIYAILPVLSNGAVCLSNWIYIRRYTKPHITFHPHFREHLKPLLIMFSNLMAISIYVNFDVTMLGWIRGDSEVGFYTVSVRIYTILKNMLASVYAVAIPRLAAFVGDGDYLGYKELNTKMWRFLSIILIPCGFGLACISNEIMLFMGGTEYLPATMSLQILSGALVFAIYGGLITMVVNNTIGREKDNLIVTIYSAVINCSLNFIFIPIFGLYGAAVTTLISELFVFVYCFRNNSEIRRYLDVFMLRKDIIDALLGSVFIILVSLIIKYVISAWLIRMLLIIMLGGVAYGVILLLRKNELCIYVLEKIKKRLLRREVL